VVANGLGLVKAGVVAKGLGAGLAAVKAKDPVKGEGVVANGFGAPDVANGLFDTGGGVPN